MRNVIETPISAKMKFQILVGALMASTVAASSLPLPDLPGNLFNKDPPTEEEAAKWENCTEDFIGRLGESTTGTAEACMYVDCMGQVANEYSRGGVLGILAGVLGGPCAAISRVCLTLFFLGKIPERPKEKLTYHS